MSGVTVKVLFNLNAKLKCINYSINVMHLKKNDKFVTDPINI